MQSYVAILKEKGLDRPPFGRAPVVDGDLYALRLQQVLRQICQPDYPSGMIPWLASANPERYAELTSRIPDEIDRLWNERAPLKQFESELAYLVSVHRRCCEDYHCAQA
jgi:hypothetical protein